MKLLSILLMTGLVLWNPSKALASSSEDEILNPIDKALTTINVKFQNPLRDVDQNLNSYSELLKLYSEFKLFDVQFINKILYKVKNHDTLSGDELYVLRHTVTTNYKLNKKILDFAKVYDFGGFKMSKAFATTDANIPLIKAHLIWLSGHLLVLDHLQVMHNLLYLNKGDFRRIVKNALLDKSTNSDGMKKTLDDIIKMCLYTVDIGESAKFTQQIILVRGIVSDLKITLESDAAAKLLVDAISTNPTSTDIAQGKTKFAIRNFTYIDAFFNAVDSTFGFLSRTFGNIAGAIRWRKGYLYRNDTALEIAIKNLKPMDLVLEKSPFVLTDKFIPGHYGHVAIYLGTKDQLEEIGMWNHPDIIPYHKDIAAGKVILEAVRTGVRLNTLEEFMNIDELTIVTKVDGLKNTALLTDMISHGMDQIGKKYDFNFDVSTLDKVVCSELIYMAFGYVHWPTQYQFGRPTITPDNIAEILFQKNTKFKIKNFMIAKEKNQIKMTDISYISNELDYELRSENGDPIQTQGDPTNSYWKKETKCYNLSLDLKRICKTSYKEFLYEERRTIN